MTALLVILAVLVGPALIVVAYAFGLESHARMRRRDFERARDALIVHDSATRPTPVPPASRGDVVAIVGTGMSAQVVCVDASVAWCRIGRMQLSGIRLIEPGATPQPIPLAKLDVLERDVPVFGAVN